MYLVSGIVDVLNVLLMVVFGCDYKGYIVMFENLINVMG